MLYNVCVSKYDKVGEYCSCYTVFLYTRFSELFKMAAQLSRQLHYVLSPGNADPRCIGKGTQQRSIEETRQVVRSTGEEIQRVHCIFGTRRCHEELTKILKLNSR